MALCLRGKRRLRRHSSPRSRTTFCGLFACNSGVLVCLLRAQERHSLVVRAMPLFRFFVAGGRNVDCFASLSCAGAFRGGFLSTACCCCFRAGRAGRSVRRRRYFICYLPFLPAAAFSSMAWVDAFLYLRLPPLVALYLFSSPPLSTSTSRRLCWHLTCCCCNMRSSTWLRLNLRRRRAAGA